jgi:hypothetical protein
MPQHLPDEEAANLAVVAIERLDLRFTPRAWRFADERRAEIDAHFVSLQRAKPALFNGRVLLMHRHAIADGVLQGDYLETDFASFIAWRDWGFPDPEMRNCFALGGLRGSDGGFVLGVMGAHTASAGRIYFPGGTPDPSDVFDGRVDLDASVRREVEEETGLVPDALTIAPGWTAVLAGSRIALIKVMQARESAAALCDRIDHNLASETTPELDGLHVVRSLADVDQRMPAFNAAFFLQLWGRESAAATDALLR